MLQWARANGCPWNEDTCGFAAFKGHLDILQWAYSNGCPWDEITCAWAADSGYLEVLHWARANGCPWVAYTFRMAAYGKQTPRNNALVARGRVPTVMRIELELR